MDDSSVTRTAPPLTRSLATDHASAEVHHAIPRCLLRLYDATQEPPSADGERFEAWLEFEREATRWGVPVEIRHSDLEALVEQSAVVLEREAHRLLHRNDW